METISNSIEDGLINGLSYKLDATSSYITDRKSCTFYAMGGNSYAPNSGTKVIKLVLNSGSWLDPSTIKIQFDVNNLGDAPLRTLSGGWSFIRRLRCLVGGVVVEDIDNYARVHQMFDVLQSEHVRNNEAIENFGRRYDDQETKALLKNPAVKVDGTIIQPTFLNEYISIRPGETKTVCFTPLSGIASQSKFIPLSYCPITYELEICSNLWDPIISPLDPRWDETASVEFQAAFGNDDSNHSSKWQIINPVIKCDVITMDNELQNQFSQIFLSGQSIPINFSTFIVQQQALAGQSPSVNITRALSRLKSVFCTFSGRTPLTTLFNKLHDYDYAFSKDFNNFYHPMAGQMHYHKQFEFEISLQIGSKKFPEYPLTTQADTFAALKKCMGIQQSSFHSLDISPHEYRSHKYIVGIDLEKSLQSAFSGENIKNGSLLTLMMKNIGNTPENYPTNITVVMHADCILNIRDTGVEILD